MKIIFLIPFFAIGLARYGRLVRTWIRLAKDPGSRGVFVSLNALPAFIYTTLAVFASFSQPPRSSDGFIDLGDDFPMDTWLALFLVHLLIFFIVVESGMIQHEKESLPGETKESCKIQQP